MTRIRVRDLLNIPYKLANAHFYHRISGKTALKLFSAFILTLALLSPSGMEAQSGGKKRERKGKRRGDFVLFRYKSQGHADEFARGSSGRRTFWSKLFRRDKPAWTYRRSGNAVSNYRENRFLFFRHRSRGRDENAMIQDRQKRKRDGNRERGNSVFKNKKYKRAK